MIVPQPLRAARSITAALLLTLLTAVAVSAQRTPPVVENGFDGSLRRPPVLEVAAVAGEDAPEEGMIMRPLAMLVTAEGDLYLSDIMAHAVLVYGPDGRFKRRIGKEGSGPGELQMPAGIYLAWNGELVVPDPRNGRTNYYSPGGEFLRSEGNATGGIILVTGQVGRIQTRPGEYLRAGPPQLPFVPEGMPDPTGGREPKLVEIIDEEENVLRAIGDRVEADDPQQQSALNNVDFDYHDGKVLIAFRFLNEIRVYDAATGAFERIIRRRLAFDPVPVDVRLTQREGNEGEVMVSMMLTGDPVTLDAAFDPQGRIWVLSWVIGTEEAEQKEEEGDYTGMVRLEVFDREGKLLAGIPLEEPADRMAFAPDGSLWLMDARFSATARRMTIRWP